MGRFLSQKDMSAARYETEVVNSMVKRGELKANRHARHYHVVCGCGAEGCIFTSGVDKERLKEYPYF